MPYFEEKIQTILRKIRISRLKESNTNKDIQKNSKDKTVELGDSMSLIPESAVRVVSTNLRATIKAESGS